MHMKVKSLAQGSEWRSASASGGPIGLAGISSSLRHKLPLTASSLTLSPEAPPGGPPEASLSWFLAGGGGI